MYKIEDIQIQDLGKVGEVTISKDDCLLMKVIRTNDKYLVVVHNLADSSYLLHTFILHTIVDMLR